MSGDLKAGTTCNLLIVLTDVERKVISQTYGNLPSAALRNEFLPVTQTDLLVD